MTDIQIETQYSTGASRQAIELALVAAGKDLGHLRPEDLALLEDFHTMGRIATAQLADLAEITPGDQVLDAGSGIGGTARYIAGRSRCHVVAVDLTEEYCQTARWLNQLARLADRISVRQADVTDLPFEDATFTLMFSQHVQMNVADKALLYEEARRVLVNGGRLAVWDIVAGENGEPDFPVPWADRPEYSHLTTSDRLRTTIETSGFEIEQWNDLTGQAAAIMQTLLTLPPSPIGLQAFVPDFEAKADNLTAALADGRLRAVQGVARAVSDVWSNATGTVSFLQLFGIGAGFAVLISRAAWYAPAPLRRVQTRIGLAEARGQPIPAPIDPPRGPGSWA